MMAQNETFQAVAVTALALTIVAVLAARIRIPPIAAFVLTGALVGPSGLAWVKAFPAAQAISELGIVFLMFSLGLEVSPRDLKTLWRPMLQLGFVQVLGTLGLGMALCLALGMTWPKAFLLGSCLALSSTAIVLKLLQDKRETETPYGRISILILLFQDIAAVILLAVTPLLWTTPQETGTSDSWGLGAGKILLFVLGAGIAGVWVVPRVFSEVLKTKSRGVFFFSILSITLVTAGFAEVSGLSLSLGAFVAGLLISESPYNKQALAELGPFRDIFLGFFFASAGMLLDFKFMLSHGPMLLGLVGVAFGIKFLVVYGIARISSHSHGVSFAAGLALTQIGEFSFVLATAAHLGGLLSVMEFQSFLALAVLSLLATPLLVSFGLRGSGHASWPELGRELKSALRLSEKRVPEVASSVSLAVAPRKTLVIGLGHAGRKCLEALKENGIPCVGIDLNMENVRAIQSEGFEGVYGDSTRQEVLESAGIHHAFLVIVTVSGRHATPQIVAMIERMNPHARVLVRIHYFQELRELSRLPSESVVVSEFETAHTIVDRALEAYRHQRA